MTHDSDSQAQRDAECYMLKVLAEREGFPILAESVSLEDGVRIVLDGFNRERRYLCEVYAHLGPTRGAQGHKIARDVLKLVAAELKLGGTWRKVLCFSDPVAAQAIENKSWLAAVCRMLEVKAVVVPLSQELHERVTAAQRRQVMVNPQRPGI